MGAPRCTDIGGALGAGLLLWLAPCGASAYPEFQSFVKKQSGRSVDCALCHASADGPDGTKPGQIGSLKPPELARVRVAAGGLTALYSISASLVRVGAGGIADRIGGEKALALGLVVMGIGATVLTLVPWLSVATLAILVMAVGMGAGNAAVFKLVPQVVPKAVGGAAGWVGGLGAVGGFVLPPLLAAVVSWRGAAGYTEGYAIFVLLAVVALAVTMMLRRARLGAEMPAG